MTDNTPRQAGMNQHDTELDRQLDAALSKFATIEPRAGLQQRILANLRIEEERGMKRSWWRWPAVAALAAVIVVSLSVAWRSGRPVQNIARPNTQSPLRTNGDAGAQIANKSRGGSNQPHEAGPARRLKPHSVGSQTRAVASQPKLDQFPSPEPLSEQETILARYVTNYPAHAALIAQARTDELRRDSAEEMSEAASSKENSQQQNR